MSEDEKQTSKPDTSVPEQTAADQLKEALSKADTVVEPGILTRAVPDPFEDDPGPDPQPEPVVPAATPDDGTGSGNEPDSSSEKQ